MANAELQQRVASSVVLLSIAGLGIWQGGPIGALVLAALGLCGIYEWLNMICPARTGLLQSAAYAGIMAILVAGYGAPPDIAVLILVLAAVGLFFLTLHREPSDPEAANDPARAQRAAWVALGVPYIGGGLLGIALLRSMPDDGLGLTLFLMLSVWGMDVGAFVFGRWLKGPKLLPEVSPSKTWAGFIGGIASAAILGYACAMGFQIRQPFVGLVVAVFLAVVAQIGDLFESAVKRRCGVKDSGQLIPGHGGMLDRIDGLIFAAAVLAVFQMQFGEKIAWW